VARNLFEQGKLHWQNRRFAEAVSLFSASYAQNPLTSPLLLLADCYEQLGRLRTARDVFQRAAAQANQQGDLDLARRAETRAAALQPRVPQLELRVPRPLPAGLVVTLNGTELPNSGLNVPVPMDAGSYRVEARAPGYEAISVPFGVSNESTQGEPVKVVAVALRPIPDTFDRRDLALWLGGAGAAVAVAGLAVVGVALYKDNGQDPADKDDARWLAKWLGTGSALISIPALGAAAARPPCSTAPPLEPSALGMRWTGSF
jgi:tetratricopeptide (TPR) repeat protein